MFGFDNSKTDISAPVANTGQPMAPTGAPAIPSGGVGSNLTPPPAVPTDQPSMDYSGDTVPPEPMLMNDATSASVAPAASAPATDDLLQIKQDALQRLSPLVGHLDQSPEDRFKTTMMMIQASDDQSLIPTAYEAANAIESEKVRAQALLDIVNEINYFTQQDHHKN